MRNKWIVCLMLLWNVCKAQELLLQGRITFERKENMQKLMADEMDGETNANSWYQEMRKVAPKYRTDILQLNFSTTQSFYQLITEDDIPFNQHWFRVCYKNKVLTDFEHKTFTSEKTVYEKVYRISDSLPQFQWKLSNEYREIAGKKCRKATTILFDSVFVIAFYTDEIPVSGGPESFQGLPGMILGIVIPRIHYTCFATHIQSQLLAEKDMQLPVYKRKPAERNLAAFKAEMLDAFEDWGNDAAKIYWRVMF